jgi:hypothetical protein
VGVLSSIIVCTEISTPGVSLRGRGRAASTENHSPRAQYLQEPTPAPLRARKQCCINAEHSKMQAGRWGGKGRLWMVRHLEPGRFAGGRRTVRGGTLESGQYNCALRCLSASDEALSVSPTPGECGGIVSGMGKTNNRGNTRGLMIVHYYYTLH